MSLLLFMWLYSTGKHILLLSPLAKCPRSCCYWLPGSVTSLEKAISELLLLVLCHGGCCITPPLPPPCAGHRLSLSGAGIICYKLAAEGLITTAISDININNGRVISKKFQMTRIYSLTSLTTAWTVWGSVSVKFAVSSAALPAHQESQPSSLFCLQNQHIHLR